METTREALGLKIHGMYPKLSREQVEAVLDGIKSGGLYSEDVNIYVKAKRAVRSWIRHKFTRYNIECKFLGKSWARRRNYDTVMVIDKYFQGLFLDPKKNEDLKNKYKLERI